MIERLAIVGGACAWVVLACVRVMCGKGRPVTNSSRTATCTQQKETKHVLRMYASQGGPVYGASCSTGPRYLPTTGPGYR